MNRITQLDPAEATGKTKASFDSAQARLGAREIADARNATATSGKTEAVLRFARRVAVNRGEVNDADLSAARASGLSDGNIVETIANVAVNIFTNYLNHVAHTVVDFPEVKPGEFANAETGAIEKS